MSALSKSERVSRLVEHFGRGNKSEFARLIGTTPQVIATWIARDTINYDLVYAKCEGINASWLLSGVGAMLGDAPYASQDTAGVAILSEVIQQMTDDLKCKNNELGELRERVGRAEAMVEVLQRELAKDLERAGDAGSGSSALAV